MRYSYSAMLTLVLSVVIFSNVVRAAEELNFPPAPYPEYCHASVRSYEGLPSLERSPDYVSPNETVVNYTEVEGEGLESAISNAVNSFGSMNAYAGQMAQAYENAAQAYWREIDRKGDASPQVRNEYAYWIWRRFRFNGEISTMRAIYLQTGAGAAKFLADRLNAVFPVPNDVRDHKTAQIYDYVKYSDCTPAHAQTLDGAIRYEIFLDNYPDLLDRMDWVEEQMDFARFTDEQKRVALQLMRQNRKFSTSYPPRSGMDMRHDKVLEAIEAASPSTPPALADFLTTFEYARAKALGSGNYMTLLTDFGDAAHQRTLRGSIVVRAFVDQTAESLPDGVTLNEWRSWSQGGAAPEPFTAMDAQQAALCAVEKFNDGARYLYSRMSPVFDELAEEKEFLNEYCTQSKPKNYKSAYNRQRSIKKICLGEDAYRVAFFSCLTGKPIGQLKSMADILIARYP